MNVSDIVCAVIIIAIVGGIGVYLYKAKKAGKHCIGCPSSGKCGKNKCGCCSSKKSENGIM